MRTLVFFLLAICIAFASRLVDAAFIGKLKEHNLDFKTLLTELPTITEALSSKMTRRQCKDELLDVQLFVQKKGESLTEDKFAAIDIICKFSESCVSEIVSAVEQVVPGGEETLSRLMSEYSKGLTKGMKVETLVRLYYQSVCHGKSVKQKEEDLDAHFRQDL